MASASGGGESGRTPKIFKFSTPLEIFILDQNDHAYEEDLEDHTELEKCLSKLPCVTVNNELKATVQLLGLEKGIVIWGASSHRDVDQFCRAVRKKEIQMTLNEFVEKKKLRKTLNLGHGKTIDIDVKINNSKNLKEEAKEYFEACSQSEATKTVPDETTRQKSIDEKAVDGQTTEVTKDVTLQMSEDKPLAAGNGEAQIKQTKPKSVRVVLYSEMYKSSCIVAMKYYLGSNNQNTMYLTYDKEIELWTSRDIYIDPGMNLDIAFRFEINQSGYFNWSKCFKDEALRHHEILSPFVREVLGRFSVDAYVAHALHIIQMNKQEKIGNYRHEIDYLMKHFELCTLNNSEKTKLFSKLMHKIENSEKLKCLQSYVVVAYIVDKLQAPVENVSKNALTVLESLSLFHMENRYFGSWLEVFQQSAEQMCRRAYSKSACVLLLMKHTYHLFTTTYFKTLLVKKMFPFSSDIADNDNDLCFKMFHELAKKAMHDHDASKHLFEAFVEHIPYSQILSLDYEKYQNSVHKVEHILENHLNIDIATLKETMNLKDLEELCLGISKHPSLVKKYSQALTKLVLQMLKAPASKPLTEAEMIRIVRLPLLFNEKKDKETLFLYTSSSNMDLYHGHFLKLLDEFLIDDPTIISKTAEDWLDVLFKAINQQFKMPTDGINMLYEKLQKLLSIQKVHHNEKLARSLEEKVYRCLERLDVELLLKKCLEKRLCVDDLFFVHLQQLANQKTEEVLHSFEKVLNPNEIECLGVGG